MISLLSILALGFVLGMRHATDADHVVAVTTIISRERSLWQAAGIGVVWGIGHTVTIVAVGSAILICGWMVPPRLGMSLEFSVGIMLVVLGVWSLRSFRREARVAAGVPACRQERPATAGAEAGRYADAVGALDGEHVYTASGARGHLLRPLTVGCVHGLAGSAAVALLVLPVIQDHFLAFVYLLVFGTGTIAGMMLITAAMALPFKWTAARSLAVHRRLGHAAALVSVGFGAFLLYDIGFVQGLFR